MVNKNITSQFPSLSDISVKANPIHVYLNNVYQYSIFNNTQLNNLRAWAMLNKRTDDLHFLWKNQEIKINPSGDLSDFPKGMLDGVMISLNNLFRLRRDKNIQLNYVNHF